MKPQKTSRTYVELFIGDITSASENLRDAVPRLSKAGYGVFKGTNKDKSLASMALSDDALVKKQYVTLMDANEPDIVSLANNMVTMGLLEPIGVREAEEKGKYDLIFGCRRTLAWLYNHAKSAGKVPARITAEIVESEGDNSLLMSLSENIRLEPSPIDEAKSFRKLEKTFGMKASEIAKAMGKDEKVVRERLKLLKLPADVQEKVHLRRLSQKKALADKGNPNSPQVNQRRAPTLKEIDKLYNTPQDQLSAEYKALVTEDVRKLFAFWLGCNYQPLPTPAPLE